MIALITGASSGIGKDMAKELAKRKYNLIIVARDEEKLKEVKKEIEELANVKVEIKKVDLSKKEECIQLHEEVSKKYGAIDVLVNNAGFGDCGEFTKTSLEKEISMIETNIIAYHILMKLFLQDMVAVDRGHILNIASIAGFLPGPLMSTYYSTKAYVVRLTQSVRQELFMKRSKVKVTALCPGPVDTNFNKVANVKFNMMEAKSKDVARYGINKMLRNRILAFPKISTWIIRVLAKILPDQVTAFFSYFIQKRKI